MKCFFSLVFCLICFNTNAASVVCPKAISTKQSLEGNSKGFETFIDEWNAIYPLNQVTFYANHPREHASLTPDNERPKDNQLTWTFGKEDIWLACGYANTSLQLIQKLPNTTKQCIVTYSPGNDRAISIKCKYH